MCAVLLLCVFGCRHFQTPKFQSVTVELGTERLTIEDFRTDNAVIFDISFVTDPSVIDLGNIGDTDITLRHGFQEETVVLSVRDTIPPEADVMTSCQIPVSGFPEASALVCNIQDASEVRVYYREEPRVPLDYGDLPVTVVLEDACGNRTEKVCSVSFRWMPETVEIELGEQISAELVLYNPDRDACFVDPLDLNRARSGGIGEYMVRASVSGRTQECLLKVEDTMGPELILQDVQLRSGQRPKLSYFVKSADDPSGVAQIRCVTELEQMPRGSHDIVVEAEDTVGNITRKEAKLYVTSDFTAPTILGEMSRIVLEKNAELPDLLQGIRANDDKDGPVPVECDTGNIDMSAGGVQYAVYRAVDSSGNVALKKREIVIVHDEEDTLRLVKEIADTFADDDVEGMRNFVYYGIGYNWDWGGEDPVWYGFTEKRGNCYVHTLCMKALLDAKGIENQLIWTTDESHYWLIVRLNSEWKHIEPTPSIYRMSILMDDEERMATLSGRDWDRTRWPACGNKQT